MKGTEEGSDMGKLSLIEDQACGSVLYELEWLEGTDGEASKEDITIVEPRNDHGLNQDLGCFPS